MTQALSRDHPPYLSFQILIEYYSKRKLSYEHDTINAVAGLLRMLSDRLGCKMIQGLPTSGLDAHLLFLTPQDPSRDKRRVQFASYSWAGWKGRVQFLEHVSAHFFSPLDEPTGWARECAWISWSTLTPNGAACSISDLPDTAPDKSHLKSAARTRLIEEIPSIQPDVEKAISQVEFTKLVHRYQYPLLTFMTVSAFFKVSVKADHGDWDDTFEVSNKDSDFCGYMMYDQSPPETSKTNSEFILLSETNNTYGDFPSLRKADTKRDNPQVQSDREEDRNVHSGDEDTGNQMPYSGEYLQETDQMDYYWVMLIEWDNGVAERRGIGKIFKTAAEKSFPPGPVWKQIILA